MTKDTAHPPKVHPSAAHPPEAHAHESHIHYRPMHPHEAEAVCHLVAKVFAAAVAPHFTPEGVTAFLQYLRPDELWKRLHHEHFVLVAEEKGKLVGMIELFDENHISLLFVDPPHQGQGIARYLVKMALIECQHRRPGLTRVSVDATPNAVPAYMRLGFQPVAPEQCENGMRVVPMVIELPETHATVHEPHEKSRSR